MKKRKFVTSVLCAAVLALGLISCNKENVEGSDEGAGFGTFCR